MLFNALAKREKNHLTDNDNPIFYSVPYEIPDGLPLVTERNKRGRPGRLPVGEISFSPFLPVLYG